MTLELVPSLPEPARDEAAPPAPDEVVFGLVSSLLRVHGSVAVHGEVAGGASLAWGARLAVHGSFRGPAHLSPGAVLWVHGSYDGERIGHDGTVVVSGQCSLEAARLPGTAVEVGTVLVGERRTCWTVDADGRLVTLPGRHHRVAPDTSGCRMRWSERLERFVRA